MDDLYDEFGNYLGDAASEDSDHGDDAPAPNLEEYQFDNAPADGDASAGAATNDQQLMRMDVDQPGVVVLHEDKQYYPSAQEVYGPDVETLVQEQDTQTLAQPIVAPIVIKKFTVEDAELPPTYFSREFLAQLMAFPDQVRNVALVGDLHHGKSSLMDMLVLETHDIQRKLDRRSARVQEEQLRYTDIQVLERERGLSVKCAPMSLVLQNTKGKSHMLNIIDTPGHVNFVDEVASALRLVDGVVLVVDVVEGVQVTSELVIKHAMLENLPIVLVINKMDRLILELRIPPREAYHKLKHLIEQVNNHIDAALPNQGDRRRVSPEKGNVAFMCASLGWCFTVQSFSKFYTAFYPDVNAEDFSLRLWGDVFFDPATRKFFRKGKQVGAERAFEHFIMNPVYKLFSQTLSKSPAGLKAVLADLNIELKPSELVADAKVLLKLVCSRFFGPANALVDMIVQHVPSPVDGAARLIERHYTGPSESKVTRSMSTCDQDGPLVVHITKLFNSSDAKSFGAFGRVLSGTVKPGDALRVLGEAYSLDDEEDMATATVSDVWIAESRYNLPVSGVPAGCFVLLGGIDNTIVKTATVIAPKFPDNENAFIFRPIRHFFEPVFKVAVEPFNPSELPKMLDGLRKVGKSYPLLSTKVEESGEHIILGTGELCMDSVLHDLRRLYADMEIKVSDAVTRFCETVIETSSLKCYALTPNKKNKVTMIAEPLSDGLTADIESGRVNIRDPARVVAKFFEDHYGYDALAARNLWAFGPDDSGPNILQNDTLPTDVDAKLVRSVRDALRHGFSWAAREGPLCEEPMRNAKFRITDLTLANEPIYRGAGQVIPTARRSCYSSFLMASPRLMEPIYACSIICPNDIADMLEPAFARRRGHIIYRGPIAGTPLQRVKGLVPVIDSFGFETDIRIASEGQATVSLVFDRWSIVPGDPLDRSVKLIRLEPAEGQATARDFVLKTRRRKGLAEDVNVSKFLEPELLQSMKESGFLDD